MKEVRIEWTAGLVDGLTTHGDTKSRTVKLPEIPQPNDTIHVRDRNVEYVYAVVSRIFRDGEKVPVCRCSIEETVSLEPDDEG